MRTQRPFPMRAITCPRCGGTSIEFITEYHKCIWLKFFRNLLLILAVASFALYLFLFLQNMTDIIAAVVDTIEESITNTRNSNELLGAYDIFLYISAALVVVSFAMQTVIYFAERRTHVQGICRSCGNIWRLN